MIVILWNIIEYTATIIECLICADFSVKFFQPKSQKAKNICFISVFIYDAAVTILLNSLMLYEGALGFIRVIGNFLIMLAYVRGSFFQKAMAAVLVEAALLLVSYTSINSMVLLFDISIGDIVQKQGFMRFLCIFVTRFLFFMFTRLMIKIKRKDTYLLSIWEWLAMLIVFLITVFVEMEIFNVTLTHELSLSDPSVLAAAVALIFVNVFIYALMIRISRKNTDRIGFMIDKMQLEVYKKQLYETEKQYNDIKAIRHDIKNHLQCVSTLLNKNEIDQAKDYIKDMLENKLDFDYQQVRSGNRAVDVVANTKIYECRNRKIKTVIGVSLISLDMDDLDICIVLGNLLDNAIEACEKLDEDDRIIYLDITQQKSYVKMIIRNPICESVLENNPEFKTSKPDVKSHGYGIKSVREVIARNSGMIDFYENNGYFIAEAWRAGKEAFD